MSKSKIARGELLTDREDDGTNCTSAQSNAGRKSSFFPEMMRCNGSRGYEGQPKTDAHANTL